MGSTDIPAGQPPAERDDSNQEQLRNFEHFEADVEDSVQEHGAEETGHDDFGPFVIRSELRGSQRKTPDAGKDYVTGHRHDRPNNAYHNTAIQQPSC